jgi:hypothetical protein
MLKVDEHNIFKEEKQGDHIKSSVYNLISMQGKGDGYYLQASATQNGLSRTVLFNIIATRYR